MRQVQLLDTSIIVELLEVPGESSRHVETVTELDRRSESPIELQMPVASLVEAGGHVGRIVGGYQRRECASRLKAMVLGTLERVAPWSFTRQFLEMGDLLIVAEFRRLRANLDRRVVDVDVWTYDGNLRAVIDDLKSN